MSGTKSPSPKAPATDVDGATDPHEASWPVWKLATLFYPFTTAAVAINLFMLGLVGEIVEIGGLSPVAALLWSIPIGVPVTWAVGRWVRRLLDEAEQDSGC